MRPDRGTPAGSRPYVAASGAYRSSARSVRGRELVLPITQPSGGPRIGAYRDEEDRSINLERCAHADFLEIVSDLEDFWGTDRARQSITRCSWTRSPNLLLRVVRSPGGSRRRRRAEKG